MRSLNTRSRRRPNGRLTNGCGARTSLTLDARGRLAADSSFARRPTRTPVYRLRIGTGVDVTRCAHDPPAGQCAGVSVLDGRGDVTVIEIVRSNLSSLYPLSEASGSPVASTSSTSAPVAGVWRAAPLSTYAKRIGCCGFRSRLRQ